MFCLSLQMKQKVSFCVGPMSMVGWLGCSETWCLEPWAGPFLVGAPGAQRLPEVLLETPAHTLLFTQLQNSSWFTCFIFAKRSGAYSLYARTEPSMQRSGPRSGGGKQTFQSCADGGLSSPAAAETQRRSQMLAQEPHVGEVASTGLLAYWFQENCGILRELVTLRAQKSSLLGFSTHADYVLEMNMAKTSQAVATFLGNWPSPLPACCS